MTKSWTYEITDKGIGERIVTFAPTVFPILGSRSATKKALSAGRLMVNGEKPLFSYRLQRGDIIELQGSGVQKIKKYVMDLEVPYQDEHLIIVNKPGGIAVNGNRFKTIENAVADRNHQLSRRDALPRPVAVHRLDVPTNGLVLLARTKTALIRLGRAFQENRVQKEYIAIVHGKPPDAGRFDAPVGGKNAVTEFKTLRTVPSRVFGHLSKVRLKPVTGRTHQLRIHLKSNGHLIVGDRMYQEDQKTILGKGVFLCAAGIRFDHPETKKPVQVRIDPPPKFEKLLNREQQRFHL